MVSVAGFYNAASADVVLPLFRGRADRQGGANKISFIKELKQLVPQQSCCGSPSPVILLVTSAMQDTSLQQPLQQAGTHTASLLPVPPSQQALPSPGSNLQHKRPRDAHRSIPKGGPSHCSSSTSAACKVPDGTWETILHPAGKTKQQKSSCPSGMGWGKASFIPQHHPPLQQAPAQH